MPHQEIYFTASDGRQMKAALKVPASPTTTEKYPALLMIHDVFGLSPEMHRIGEELAKAGYVVLVPDIFDRPGLKAFCVVKALKAVATGHGPAVEGLQCARKYLEALPEVDSNRLGVLGFCMGGGFTVLLARGGQYRAAAPFYGLIPKSEDTLEGICPVVGSYGGKDKRLLPTAARLEKELTELNVRHDIKIYPEANHGFMTNHQGILVEKILPMLSIEVRYDDTAANDAWKRTFNFFETHLNR